MSKQETTPPEKLHIKGAGGMIISKSVLNGEQPLKWLFRDEAPYGSGWVAFGAGDDDEYVNNADNLTIIDFNELIDMEPAAYNVYHMPVGTELEFCVNKGERFFVDCKTGKAILEPVKHPMQLAFEQNLRFLNQPEYPEEFWQGLFQENEFLQLFDVGEIDLSTGELVLADPLSYLGTKYQTVLARQVAAGSYPVQLAVMRTRYAGLRYVAARLLFSREPAVRHEIAMPKGYNPEDLGKPRVFSFFGVDAGLACFTDMAQAQEYQRFAGQWYQANQGKNIYDDYFAGLFAQSYEQRPEMQRQGGDFLCWQLPESGSRLIMFTSGLGDGVYSAYWGFDADDASVELVIPFMNPEFFR